jgi:hypothetical protein
MIKTQETWKALNPPSPTSQHSKGISHKMHEPREYPHTPKQKNRRSKVNLTKSWNWESREQLTAQPMYKGLTNPVKLF